MFSDRRYESELERIFDWNFEKYVEKGVTIQPQHECATMLGTFRLDFLIKGKLKVGVELDGEEFHDEFRDECRDAIILGENHVDVIYRFKGKDIYHNTADMLHLMAKCDPWIFSDGGRANLKTLRCRRFEQMGEIDPEYDLHFLTVSFFENDEEKFRGTEASRRAVVSKHRQHWRYLYEDALATRPPNVDAMVEAQKAAWTEKATAAKFDSL
jgi:hypothetical protein